MSAYDKKPVFLIALALLVACTSCGHDDPDVPPTPTEPDKPAVQIPINISATITRATEEAFESGDRIGLFVVNRNVDGSAATLKPLGNHLDNMRHTFDEANNQWEPAYDIYWKDKHTHIDVYGYYPFANPESIDDYQFEVQKEQSRASADGEWANTEKIVLAPNLVRKASVDLAIG
ncbi:fimbrillin family protein [Leyella stercorea]|uniref:fimbrillin family protein n=1 Tax=Leyella stercorea TaxID=363265 RepID=UPI00242E603B|nr:fimbrillin family protein [Leyella stercorea]